MMSQRLSRSHRPNLCYLIECVQRRVSSADTSDAQRAATPRPQRPPSCCSEAQFKRVETPTLSTCMHARALSIRVLMHDHFFRLLVLSVRRARYTALPLV